MDRRHFLKSMLSIPFFTPLLQASTFSVNDAELFLLSDTPHFYLPPLLDELKSMGIVSGTSFTLEKTGPETETLSRELVRNGWQRFPRGDRAHLALSTKRLQESVSPSFTLA